MKRVCLFCLIFFTLLTASGCNYSSMSFSDQTSSDPIISKTEDDESKTPIILGVELTDDLPQRERNWLEDLETLRKAYDRYHYKPYSREEFEGKLSHLAARVGNLSDNDIAYEIVALIAGMDDNHTWAGIPFAIDDTSFPLSVKYWGDKLYLAGYLEEYDQFEPYLLREIVAVNGVDMTYLRRKFELLLSPSNYWYSKERFGYTFFWPGFFDWAGCNYKEGYTIQFLNENQEVISVDVPVISIEDYLAHIDSGSIVTPEVFDSLHYLKRGNWAGYFDEETDDYVYMSFTDQSLINTESYQALFQETAALIQAHPNCDKLVIDLRFHTGGLLDLLDDFYELTQLLKVPSIQHTYVLIGGYTISAAICDICLFKGELDAVTVGEPTGQFTTFYGYTIGTLGSPKVVLPHSQIPIYISDCPISVNDWAERVNYPKLTEEYYKEDGSLYEWENTVLPDVFVYQDIEDIRQGNDSVIQWVLAQ